MQKEQFEIVNYLRKIQVKSSFSSFGVRQNGDKEIHRMWDFYPEIRKSFGQAPQMLIFLPSINSDFTTWTGVACPIIGQHKDYAYLHDFKLQNDSLWLMCIGSCSASQFHFRSIHHDRIVYVFSHTIYNIVYHFILGNKYFFFQERQRNSTIVSLFIRKNCLTLRNKTKRWAVHPFIIIPGLCLSMYCLRKCI